ncbi:hypothetical protein [Enterococcus casseliflavus]|uniref:hypothetical protein n=1 Tax=Enterococcus casseliflavus TaxID=37734 RepID=UPI003DA54AAD
MEFKEEHIKLFGYRCVTFLNQKKTDRILDLSGKLFLIDGDRVFEAQRYHQGRSLVYRKLEPGYPLSWIYRSIRLVYDQNGVLIARRSSPKARLCATGKGLSKRLIG